MIRICFPDSASERRALAYLVGRFSFKSSADGVTLVPDYALPFLTRLGICFFVEGVATEEPIPEMDLQVLAKEEGALPLEDFIAELENP